MGLKITSIDYELDKKINKKAVILAIGEGDAIKFLRKVTGNKVTRIDNIGYDMDVHAITDDAMEYIAKHGNFKQQSPGDSKEEETTEVYKCPWCDKPFGTAQGLKLHLNKAHELVPKK